MSNEVMIIHVAYVHSFVHVKTGLLSSGNL